MSYTAFRSESISRVIAHSLVVSLLLLFFFLTFSGFQFLRATYRYRGTDDVRMNGQANGVGRVVTAIAIDTIWVQWEIIVKKHLRRLHEILFLIGMSADRYCAHSYIYFPDIFSY